MCGARGERGGAGLSTFYSVFASVQVGAFGAGALEDVPDDLAVDPVHPTAPTKSIINLLELFAFASVCEYDQGVIAIFPSPGCCSSDRRSRSYVRRTCWQRGAHNHTHKTHHSFVFG